MKIVPCTYAAHGNAILNILNEAIVSSTALYDYEPRTPESMVQWFQAKEQGQYPVLGAIDDKNTEDSSGVVLMGFASYGSFRNWPAYKYSVEHSVYVHKDHRGKGVASALMKELIHTAEKQDYHTLIAGIDVDNAGSIALHEKLGFQHQGTIRQVGFKFDRWLDLAFYQLMLSTPDKPFASSEVKG